MHGKQFSLLGHASFDCLGNSGRKDPDTMFTRKKIRIRNLHFPKIHFREHFRKALFWGPSVFKKLRIPADTCDRFYVSGVEKLRFRKDPGTCARSLSQRSQRRKRRISTGFCFDRGMGDFSSYKTKRTSSMEIFDTCTNRNYVLIDYVFSESVKYVSQCDLILDRRVCACKRKLRVNRVRTKRKWLYWKLLGLQYSILNSSTNHHCTPVDRTDSNSAVSGVVWGIPENKQS